jgi:hypothetical protein
MPTANQRKAGIASDKVNREKDDFYESPPDAVEALLSVEKFDGAIWEPACGQGAISMVLKDHGYDVVSTDLVWRGYGEKHPIDFLMEYKPLAPNIITNPPFKNANDFIKLACALSTGKVAFLLRLACLEGSARRKIFETTPLARVWVFSKRLTMWRNGVKTSDAGGTVAFAWFVWESGFTGKPTLGWL